MKQKFFYFVFLTSSFFVSTIAVSSWAKDCPEIPKDIKVITAKSDQVSLRTEAKQSSVKSDVSIYENDSLNVISPSPVKDLNGKDFCWYKVSAIKNTNDKPYFVADVGIKEFPFTRAFSSSLPLSKPSSGETKTRIQSQSIIFWQLWLGIVLGGVAVSGNVITLIFCIRRFSKQEDFLKGFQQTIVPRLDKLDKITKQSQKNVKVLSDYTLNLKDVFKDIEQRIKSLEQKQSSSINYNPVNTPVATNTVARIPVVVFEPAVKRNMMEEMVEHFNSKNPDYFRDARFKPLTLTQQSIQGQVGLNPRRIVQLEAPSDSSQSSYLTTEIDRENWLIPNITSPYISQIMRNLHENPEIFVVESGSETLRLIKPAKLKSVSSGLWEIEEPGEFSNGKISKIEPKTVLPQPLTKPVDIEKASTLDLPIILYLRKNGDTNLTDLLNNFQCDQEQLKERLIALQQEELINLIEQNDPNNPLYQLR